MKKIFYAKEVRALLPTGSHLSTDGLNELQLLGEEQLSKTLENAYKRTIQDKRKRIDPIDIHFGYWEAAKNEKVIEFIKSIEERFKNYFNESLFEIKSKTIEINSKLEGGDTHGPNP